MINQPLPRYFIGKSISHSMGWQAFLLELDQLVISNPRIGFVGNEFYQVRWEKGQNLSGLREIYGPKQQLLDLRVTPTSSWDIFQLGSTTVEGENLGELLVTVMDWSSNPVLKFESVGRFQFTKL